MTVWKYVMPQPGERTVHSMPRGAKIVHVAYQFGDICAWAVIPDEQDAKETRAFSTVGTGKLVPTGATWIGTVLQSPFVWHVFEEDSPWHRLTT